LAITPDAAAISVFRAFFPGPAFFRLFWQTAAELRNVSSSNTGKIFLQVLRAEE
jgi:hypothetical protein